VIDLAGVKANSFTFADHQLVVSEHGDVVADLTFEGHYTAGEFSLSRDGNGGTDITLATPSEAAFWTLQA
jgi:hypothetical protein